MKSTVRIRRSSAQNGQKRTMKIYVKKSTPKPLIKIYMRPRSLRGQAIVLIALGMVALIAFMVLAIDGSKYLSERRVAQNASDMASLSAVYKLETSGTFTDLAAIKIINKIAEDNGVPDTDGIAGNEINGNIQAWWTDGTGVGSTHADQLITTNNTTAPSWAIAVKVKSDIPYNTFIGGIIGQGKLYGEAAGTAKISTVPVNFDNQDGDIAGFMGGNTCNSDTDTAFMPGQSTKAYFEGTLASTGWVDPNRRPSKFQADTFISTVQTTDPLDGVTTFDDPSSSAAQAIASSGNNFPAWAYYPVSGNNLLIQASFFKPDIDASGNASGATNNYIYEDYVKKGKPGNLFHETTVGGVTKIGNYIADSGDASTNGTNLQAAMSANGSGIYYVDGDVTIGSIPNATSTIIAKGRVIRTGNNDEIDTVPSDWGFGISILAGGGTPNPPFPNGCAKSAPDCSSGYSSDAEFVADGNKLMWKGILYVPNGMAELEGNTSMTDVEGPIIAWSVGQEMCSHPANNWHFGKCQLADAGLGSECWAHPPEYVTGLNQ